MLTVYGSMQCPDCVECCADLDKAGTEYKFLDISENLLYLKEFLALRDASSAFDSVKKAGKIGIPCILWEDGTLGFAWKDM